LAVRSQFSVLFVVFASCPPIQQISWFVANNRPQIGRTPPTTRLAHSNMPRPLSSARYIVPSATPSEAEEARIRDEETGQLEPVVQAPDYLSITWLASR